MFPRVGKKLYLLSVVCLLGLTASLLHLRKAGEQSTHVVRKSNEGYTYLHMASANSTLSRVTKAGQTNESRTSIQGSNSDTAALNSDTMEIALKVPERERKRFPGVFIIGFGKSGTKALYEVLKMHPSLAGREKEVRFFSIHYSKGLSWYLNLLPQPPIQGTVIEKSPDYILTDEAAIRLKETALSLGVLPSSLRFIVMVRNPVVRAVSEYLEWKITKASKGEKLPAFDKMVLSSDGTIRNQPFVNTSCYPEHAQKWFRYFHRKQFCFLDGDAFISEPFKQVSKLEACLGLPPFFTEDNFVYNEERGFYCFKRHSLLDEKCMSKSKGRLHPLVSGELVSKLKDYFRECNEQFYKMSGTNFHWEDSNES